MIFDRKKGGEYRGGGGGRDSGDAERVVVAVVLSWNGKNDENLLKIISILMFPELPVN